MRCSLYRTPSADRIRLAMISGFVSFERIRDIRADVAAFVFGKSTAYVAKRGVRLGSTQDKPLLLNRLNA